jgi:hypothetical protein
MDALDRIKSKPFTKEQKQAWAAAKAAENEVNALKDPRTVKYASLKYRQIIEETRRRLGLG